MQTIGSRSGSTVARAKKIALCRRCRRQVLPKSYGSAFRASDLHRTASKDMVGAPSAEAERIRRRKERKARTRQHTRDTAIIAALRSRDLHAAQRIVLELKGESTPAAVPVSEDCPECLKRQNAA